MKPTLSIDLPPRYYLDYFWQVVGALMQRSAHLLLPIEKEMIEVFGQISIDAQCLYLRMANRKGTYFRFGQFRYPEIGQPEAALRELCTAGFARIVAPSTTSPEALEAILHLYSRAELIPLFKDVLPKGMYKWAKNELVAYLASPEQQQCTIDRLLSNDVVVEQLRAQDWHMLLFLYFGNLHEGMSLFVVRDIGHARFEDRAEGQLTAIFADRQEAEAQWLLANGYEMFKQLREILSPTDLAGWVDTWMQEHPQCCQAAFALFQKLCLRMAQWLEKHQLPSEALRYYAQTTLPPSRERQVRILWQMGLRTEAEAQCLAIRQAPVNAEEYFFAHDFLAKSQGRTRRSTTQQLKKAPVIYLSPQWQGQVESGALHYFREQGYIGFFSENYAWCGLFGLLFWDILFEGDFGGYHHPFQIAPTHFYTDRFFQERRQALAERASMLARPKEAIDFLTQVAQAKAGIANPLVGWHPELLAQATALVAHLPPKGLAAVLLEMARNLKENTKGFPDLLVFNQHDYQLWEIKSPTDHLSAQQLYWLLFFEEQGIQANVLQIKWEMQA